MIFILTPWLEQPIKGIGLILDTQGDLDVILSIHLLAFLEFSFTYLFIRTFLTQSVSFMHVPPVYSPSPLVISLVIFWFLKIVVSWKFVGILCTFYNK